MTNDWQSFSAHYFDSDTKRRWMLSRLNQLSLHHQKNCEAYARMLNGIGISPVADSLESVPFLAARMFKQMRLESIPEQDVYKTLFSSGTSSQVKSRIVLDSDTAALQSRVLVAIMSSFIGKKRLPMLIIDRPDLVSDRSGFSARGAGVLGLSFLGRQHTYALNEDMTPNWECIRSFFSEHGENQIFIFGFTFMIWAYFIDAMIKEGLSFDCKNAFLLHGGGWKKLQDKAVDNSTFKRKVRDCIGEQTRVHNFYGMVEQTGSVFVECEHGVLHAPAWADVLVRDIERFNPVPYGASGLIQVQSFIPSSYPGHSILTEDIGRILGEDDCLCGRSGKYFEVLGRLPKSEVRGCSDTHS